MCPTIREASAKKECKGGECVEGQASAHQTRDGLDPELAGHTRLCPVGTKEWLSQSTVDTGPPPDKGGTSWSSSATCPGQRMSKASNKQVDKGEKGGVPSRDLDPPPHHHHHTHIYKSTSSHIVKPCHCRYGSQVSLFHCVKTSLIWLFKLTAEYIQPQCSLVIIFLLFTNIGRKI